jgi:hypothetical protein
LFFKRINLFRQCRKEANDKEAQLVQLRERLKWLPIELEMAAGAEQPADDQQQKPILPPLELLANPETERRLQKAMHRLEQQQFAEASEKQKFYPIFRGEIV